MSYLKLVGKIGRKMSHARQFCSAMAEGECNKHKCHVPACETKVHPRLLMCYYHWRLVPAELKIKVWENYVPAQEIYKDPSEEYLEAAAAAIAAVVEILAKRKER